MASRVVTVTSSSHLNTLLSPSDRISILDFTATWCGPCRAIAPIYARLSGEFSQVQFLKVDVDQHQDISARFGVSAMPTFVVCRGSQALESMAGADPSGLRRLLEKHAGRPQATPVASGSGGSSAAPGIADGLTLLNGGLDMKQVACLNEDPKHTLKDLLRGNGNGGGYLQSDADEQLILNVPLQTASKVRALRFKATPESEIGKGAKTVKVFVNQTTLGFEDAEANEPAHEEVLTRDHLLGKTLVQFRFVRFQSVNSLQIFIVDNQAGGDETRVYGLEVYGAEGDRSDMSGLKATADDE